METGCNFHFWINASCQRSSSITSSSKSSTLLPGTSITFIFCLMYNYVHFHRRWRKGRIFGALSWEKALYHPSPHPHPHTHHIPEYVPHYNSPKGTRWNLSNTGNNGVSEKAQKMGLGELEWVKPRPESRLTINTRRSFSAAKIFSSLFIALFPVLSHFCHFLLM